MLPSGHISVFTSLAWTSQDLSVQRFDELLLKRVWISCILDLSPYFLFCPQKSVDISWLKVPSNCIVCLLSSVRYENKVVPTGNSSISRNLCVVWDLNTNKKDLSLGKHQRYSSSFFGTWDKDKTHYYCNREISKLSALWFLLWDSWFRTGK